MIENNQTGKIVLFLYPTPNSLREPSLLYKNPGFSICTTIKIVKNIIIATKVTLFLINDLNIYIIITFFLQFYTF